MRIISAGLTFTDIDGFGAGIAYAELLNAQGTPAVAVFTSPLNESIPRTVRSWHPPYQTAYTPAPDDTFTVVDNSDPQYLDSIVDIDRVDEVIDHHLGFEDFWNQRGVQCVDVEFIGAACTMIYERWASAGQLDQMSQLSARLLMCGILDNTLNFGADITTDRDRAAYQALQVKADLPEDWPAQYFGECERGILADVTLAVAKDTKLVQFTAFAELLAVGQLAVWNGAELIADKRDMLLELLASQNSQGFIHVISIGEGRSYLIASVQTVKDWLSKLLSVTFDGDVAVAERLWLRKEIIKQDMGQE